MTDARHDFERQLAAAWPLEAWRDLTILVAVSGGPDSVALLRGLAALKADEGKGRIVVGHFNHHLRAAADKDEKFVVELCRRLGIECQVGHGERAANKVASHRGEGLEALLRDERYKFLQHAAGQAGARHVVTAHTADDQAETILHRIVRGTGLAGLAGIRRTRLLGSAVAVLRPMLEIRRSDVLHYLAELRQPFRKDETNKQLRFTRNRIRHKLLPQLESDYNPQVKSALLRLGKLAGEAAEYLAAHAWQHARNAVCFDDSETEQKISVSLYPLRNEPEFVVREVLRWAWREAGWPETDMGYRQWDELAAMASLAAPTDVNTFIDDRRTFPGNVDVWRRKNHLELRRARP